MVTTLTRLTRLAAAFFFCIASLAPAIADDAKLAMKGFDPVSYFTDGQPGKGQTKFAHVWDGETYLFVSAENRDRFARDPERYAPVFPGYCAAALSLGRIMRADPEQWLIIEGKLYFFAGPKGRQMALERPSLVKQSEANWAELRKAPKQPTQ